MDPAPEFEPVPAPPASAIDSRFDRQIRLFGSAVQDRLCTLAVAVQGPPGPLRSEILKNLALLGLSAVYVLPAHADDAEAADCAVPPCEFMESPVFVRHPPDAPLPPVAFLFVVGAPAHCGPAQSPAVPPAALARPAAPSLFACPGCFAIHVPATAAAHRACPCPPASSLERTAKECLTGAMAAQEFLKAVIDARGGPIAPPAFHWTLEL